MFAWGPSPVVDLAVAAHEVRTWRAGVIEAEAGELLAVSWRPWARRVSLWETLLWGRLRHRQLTGDRCWLYFHQPRAWPDFLAIDYIFSTRQATFATVRQCALMADRIAQAKGVQALLCDASNARISDRLLRRWGWTPHAPMRWRRNYIKRFELAKR